MHRMLNRLSGLAAWLMIVGAGMPAQAQTAITHTTLASAMSATADRAVVASSTNLAAASFLYIDGELLEIRSVSSTTATVRRGTAGGTPAVAHASGAVVWVGTGVQFDTGAAIDAVAGAVCTASDFLYTPYIHTRSGRIFDCDRSVWLERFPTQLTAPQSFSVRDLFDQGYTVMQDDGTAKSLVDDEDNFVYGSPLGAIEYREELGKTTSTWVTTAGVLDISADDTIDDAGVEIAFGAGELDGWIVAGTTGGCVSASITVADISGTDQVQLGFRNNAAFPDVAAYAGLTVWNTVGINATDGSIVSSQEVSEATDTDDSAVNWADGETRALRVCVSSAGVPTAFYTAAYTYAASVPDYPTWVAITMTETGSTLTAATALTPVLSYLAAGTDGPDVTINWVQLTRLPR